eukprot:m.307957 g.307957  ORF g.307957 m.307957 type:complete len:485 (+) comp15938_c0_seq6:1680-3134(+)
MSTAAMSQRINAKNRVALTAALLVLLSVVYTKGYEWPQALQGHDDDSYTMWMRGQGMEAELDARYKQIAVMKPGIRRYNMFWNGLEPQPSTSAPTSCPTGLTLVPVNETDRALRGFRRYHCYNIKDACSGWDEMLARDFQIGAHHAGIFWASPAWARNANCTGFPWGKQMNQFGCIPRLDAMDDFHDYFNFVAERYSGNSSAYVKPSAPGPLSHFVVWNEVVSAGWMDMSPLIPNRITLDNTTGDEQLTAAQFENMTSTYALMLSLANEAVTRHNPSALVWFSSDHYWLSPHQNKGDVLHVSLLKFLDQVWQKIGTRFDWGLVVHPYDAGDPNQNLWNQGIYTFDTLQNVVDYQIQKLNQSGLSPMNSTGSWRPQTLVYPSEQGWSTAQVPQQSHRARNICRAQRLSEQVPNVFAVTHNLFQQMPDSGGQGGAFYGLISPNISATLADGANDSCFNAYLATSPDFWNKRNDHYCCQQWQLGCAL